MDERRDAQPIKAAPSIQAAFFGRRAVARIAALPDHAEVGAADAEGDARNR